MNHHFSAAVKIIEKHGIDKMLFGTDSPWHKPPFEKSMIELLGLSEDEKNKIYSQNAKNLLNI